MIEEKYQIGIGSLINYKRMIVTGVEQRKKALSNNRSRSEIEWNGVCHFSILFLVSFLSMVAAIIIVRKTKELKQLEECMMENRLILRTEPKYLNNASKKWNYIKQQYTQVTKARIIIYEWHDICCETLFLLKNGENTRLP